MTILRCKVVIVGDCKVGKSSLTASFHKGKQYNKNYVMTTGADLVVKTVKIPDAQELAVELYLFDTSGHAIYKDMRPTYWAGASLVMAVYDVTNRASFESLKGWLAEVGKVVKKVGAAVAAAGMGEGGSGGKKEAAMAGILVAAKCDQSEHAAVTQQEALAFAHAHSLAFFETAAAAGRDVDVPFNFLAAKYHEMYEKKLKDVVESID